MMRTGIPGFSRGACATGTLMYSSSPAFSSIVVSIVERVTRSPTRTGNVADDAGSRRGDAVIRQLDLLLADLRVDAFSCASDVCTAVAACSYSCWLTAPASSSRF